MKKAVVAGSLEELQRKAMEKFVKSSFPRVHLDSDGTEIDDEDYFQTLEPNTELIAVFQGEEWIDVRNILCKFQNQICRISFPTANAIPDNHDSQLRRSIGKQRSGKNSSKEAHQFAENEFVEFVNSQRIRPRVALQSRSEFGV